MAYKARSRVGSALPRDSSAKTPCSLGFDAEIYNSELHRDFDPEEVHHALAKKGEALKRLWKKYNAVGTVDGRKPLSYRQYCRRYATWIDRTKVTFHIQRFPGVNTELDYAGKTLRLHDRRDPDLTTTVTIFVAALSFSDS